MPELTSNQLLEIANNILEIIEEKDDMDNSDFQGAIEAQIMIAYQFGLKNK